MTRRPEPASLLQVLDDIAGVLDGRHLPWALVGGLAVSVRTEPRFTRDVDIAVGVADDPAAEALVADLQSTGYALHAVLEQQVIGRLATVRILPPGSDALGIVIDLLFASSGIEPETCRAAERLEIAPGVTAPVARAGHLVAMKLLSRGEGRLQDQIDLQHLRQMLSEDDVRLAQQAVADIEKRGTSRGRALVRDLETYLRS